MMLGTEVSLDPTGASRGNRVILQDVLRNEIGGVHCFTRYVQKSEAEPGSLAEGSVASLGCRVFGRKTAFLQCLSLRAA